MVLPCVTVAPLRAFHFADSEDFALSVKVQLQMTSVLDTSVCKIVVDFPSPSPSRIFSLVFQTKASSTLDNTANDEIKPLVLSTDFNSEVEIVCTTVGEVEVIFIAVLESKTTFEGACIIGYDDA